MSLLLLFQQDLSTALVRVNLPTVVIKLSALDTVSVDALGVLTLHYDTEISVDSQSTITVDGPPGPELTLEI
jgi:anti-anti-sigma regulatory factor